jgi:hypothetical protein
LNALLACLLVLGSTGEVWGHRVEELFVEHCDGFVVDLVADQKEVYIDMHVGLTFAWNVALVLVTYSGTAKAISLESVCDVEAVVWPKR